MEQAVFISICIPAYKRVSFLRRLLDSIDIQSYRHFEVIVTDDSPEDGVFELCGSHSLSPAIRYFKNQSNLGTPENWNESIRHARGEWIKLMHDDDWFQSTDTLKTFAEAILANPAKNFFFSEYSDVFLDNDKTAVSEVRISRRWQKRLSKDPKTLLSSNRIGPPSVTLHKKKSGVFYDAELKWLVDVDFYIRFLENGDSFLIPENLIAVGVGEEQVTRQVFRNPHIEIPENLYVLKKIGTASLRNLIVYDAFWRFVRNLNIRSVDSVRNAGYKGQIPAVIESMIHFQSNIPVPVLKSGIFSKCLMMAHYAFYYSKL